MKADIYVIMAEKVAARSAEYNVAGVADCDLGSGGNASEIYQECGSRILGDFATRVFRRPLTGEEWSTREAAFGDDLTGGDIRPDSNSA